jgi:DNA-binding beta-propeller fold protein YncE
VLSNREAWVVDPIADSISIVDLDTATVIATLQTAPQPTDVHFAGLPPRAYVTVAQGRELLVFDPIAPTEPLTRIAPQLTPRYAEGDGFGPTGKGPR